MSALSAVYGGVARFRRSWYQRHPQSRVRLGRPVISVGNLVVGGSGKTPVVAALAATLLRLGHRPAVLSRGYGRTRQSHDVVVVSDGSHPLVPVELSGDEPQMLARDLTGVPVLVAADRARAGETAIARFDSTALILDDGFQHLRLERTVDLLVLSSADLAEKVLPSGRLREPITAAQAADAVLVYGEPAEARRLAGDVGVAQSFIVRSQHLSLRPVGHAAHVPAPGARVVAVAGIARPHRFFDAVRRQGFTVARELVFGDHHWFTAAELRDIEIVARQLGAEAIITTGKDAVRIERSVADLTLAWTMLPLEVSVEPAVEFESWLRQRL